MAWYSPRVVLDFITFWRVHDYVTCILVGIIGWVLGRVIHPHCRPFRWTDESIDHEYGGKGTFPSWTLALIAVLPGVFYVVFEIVLFVFFFQRWVTLHDPHLGWRLLKIKDTAAGKALESAGNAESNDGEMDDLPTRSREGDPYPVLVHDNETRERAAKETRNGNDSAPNEADDDDREAQTSRDTPSAITASRLRNRATGGVIVDVSSPVADYTDFHRVTGGKSDQPEGSTMHNLQKRWLKSVMPVAVSKRTWPQWRALLVLINHWILTQAFSVCLALCITDVMKVYAGRLRPDFLSRLRMDGFSSADGDGYDAAPTVDWCGKARGGRLSFPSGHSSISFSSIVPMCYFVAYFLELWRYPSYWRLVAAFIPLILPVTVAISRTRDNRHHFSDILCGSIIGCVSAMMTVALNFTIVNRRYVVPRREPQ